MGWWEALTTGGAALVGGILAVAIPPLYAFIRRTIAFRRQRRRLASLEKSAQTRSPTIEMSDRYPDLSNSLPPELATFAYITNLRMKELRCFEDVSVDLRFPGEGLGLRYPNVTLLVGNNGSGKSTALKAIAMTALAPILDSSGFVPYRLVREGSAAAAVEGTFVVSGHRHPIQTRSQISLSKRGDLELVKAINDHAIWEDLYDESSPSMLVVGYGVGRKPSDDPRSDASLERGRRRRRYQRVSSIFDESTSLIPFGSWLPQVDRQRRHEVEVFLNNLLPDHVAFTGQFEGTEPIFFRYRTELPLRALSDGFRSYISWLGDLLFHVHAVAPSGLALSDVGGIVLVDEVDLLLHPSWQRIVVPTICRALPNMQFVLTSHSPIVTGTLESSNVLIARSGEEPDSTTLVRLDTELHGLNAEQVLMSSYFGLTSTRALDAEDTLNTLMSAAIIGDDQAVRTYLRSLAVKNPTIKGRGV